MRSVLPPLIWRCCFAARSDASGVQVMGPGQDLENFFFNPNVTQVGAGK